MLHTIHRLRDCAAAAGFGLLLTVALLCTVAIPATAQTPAPFPRQPQQALLQPFPDPLGAVPTSIAAATPDGPGTPYPVEEWTKVAYQSFRTGNWEIFVAAGNGASAANVSNNPAADANPDLDAGARRLVFNSNRDGNSEIYSMNADGSDVRRLTYSTAIDYAPTWSPDGKLIAFVSDRDGSLGVYRMNADGSNVVRMSRAEPQPNVAPFWRSEISLGWIRLHGRYNELGDIMLASPDSPGVANARHRDLRLLSAVAAPIRPGYVSPDWMLGSYDNDGDGWTEIVRLDQFGTAWPIYDPGGTLVDAVADAIAPDLQTALLTRYEYVVVKKKPVVTATHLERILIDYAPSVLRLPGSGKDAASTWATSDLIAPKAEINPLPRYTRREAATITWGGGDYGGSGIVRFDVQYGNQPGPQEGVYWEDLLRGTPETGATIPFPSPGITYAFRVRATDAAGNVAEWGDPNAVQARTIVYSYHVNGSVTDNRGVPLVGVPLQGDGPIERIVTGAEGRYDAYYSDGPVHLLQPSAPGFDAWSPATVYMDYEQRYDFALPPIDNVLSNGGFEAGLTGWTGGYLATDMGRKGGIHTGLAGLGIQAACPGPCAPDQSVVQTAVTLPSTLRNPTLSFYYQGGPDMLVPYTMVEVRVADAVTSTLVYTGGTSFDWKHAWADLTPWQGQSITLTFTGLPATADFAYRMFVDDVSIGSWSTPVIDAVQPATLPEGWADQEITVTGRNFGLGTRVQVGEVEAGVRVIDEGTLAVLPPTDLAPGVYAVTVINPGGQRQVAPAAVQLGSRLALPALIKQERP